MCSIYTFDFGTIWWSGLLLFQMIFTSTRTDFIVNTEYFSFAAVMRPFMADTDYLYVVLCLSYDRDILATPSGNSLILTHINLMTNRIDDDQAGGQRLMHLSPHIRPMFRILSKGKIHPIWLSSWTWT